MAKAITRGARGAAVSDLQRALRVLDAAALPRFGVDGVAGEETFAAVRAFARAHCIAPPKTTIDPLLVALIESTAVLAVEQPAPQSWVVQGVDVSGWQTPTLIDWPELHDDGVAFVFVKASQGVSPSNGLAAHWARLEGSGILRGVYHFAELRSPIRRAHPEAQAEAFVATVGRLETPPTLPYVLDLEWQSYASKAERIADIGANSEKFPAAAVVEWAQRFGDRMRDLTGRLPILYTGPSFWRYRMGSTTALRAWPLWIADYVGDGVAVPPASKVSSSMDSGWPDGPTFWQFAGSKGRAPDGDLDGLRGFGGALDRNLFRGSLVELRQLGAGL